MNSAKHILQYKGKTTFSDLKKTNEQTRELIQYQKTCTGLGWGENCQSKSFVRQKVAPGGDPGI